MIMGAGVTSRLGKLQAHQLIKALAHTPDCVLLHTKNVLLMKFLPLMQF